MKLTLENNVIKLKKGEKCALLAPPISEKFETTADVIKQVSNSEIPALLKPKKLLGDYDVSAGFDGTPEVTKKYLCMTPGQVCEALNTIINNSLKESEMNNTAYTTDDGGKLKSFNEFPIHRTDLDDVAEKAATPEIVTMDFLGNVIHTALMGTNLEPAKAATTVEMDGFKERAMKRLAQFISSYHGNNQQSVYTKEVV